VILGIIGQSSVRLLLLAVIVGLIFHVLAIWKRTASFRKWSRFSMLLQFLFAAIASMSLIVLLIRGDYHFPYVAEYTSNGLSLIYRIAAFWGGNAGSLLFWCFILTVYGVVVAYSRHEDSERMLPIVSGIMTVVIGFYTLLVNFSANPFIRTLTAPSNGNGLNPLLQNPGMTVHPVNVYLGYVGFTVPFAYAMAGLILKKTDATWLKVTRRWTLISWLFLGIGIVYGAHWSYEELGWGGYWAWDPVENASLLPWLTGTAFLHSAIVQERKGMLKGWNVTLVTLTFLLTLLGTFLTRSGVLWSIHAFANAPIGSDFLLFLSIMLISSVGLIVYRWNTLKPDKQFEAVVSKETSFMLNNVLFLGSAFAVFWGTIFPIVSEAVTGHRMMVSGPFYNSVNLPLAVCIMLLMGIGPVVAWRRATVKSIVLTIVYPFLIAILLGIAFSGVLRFTYHRTSILATLAIIAAIFVLLTVFLEFYRSVQARVQMTGQSALKSFFKLLSKNRRRYGGYVVHLAIAAMAVGIAGSGAYHVDLQEPMTVGQTTPLIGDYKLTFAGMGVSGTKGTNADGSRSLYANLIVHEGGKTLGVLRPSATFYTNGQEPSTDVALLSQPLRDLYVVLLGTGQNSEAVFDIHVNPLVQFIWWGGYLFIIGTLVSLWPESWKAATSQQLQTGFSVEHDVLEQLAELEYDYKLEKLDEETYLVSRTELVGKLETEKTASATLRRKLERDVSEEVRRQGSHSTERDGGTSE